MDDIRALFKDFAFQCKTSAERWEYLKTNAILLTDHGLEAANHVMSEAKEIGAPEFLPLFRLHRNILLACRENLRLLMTEFELPSKEGFEAIRLLQRAETPHELLGVIAGKAIFSTVEVRKAYNSIAATYDDDSEKLQLLNGAWDFVGQLSRR